MAKSGSSEVVKSRLLGFVTVERTRSRGGCLCFSSKLGRCLRFVLGLCPWRLGEVLLPLPARKVTVGLILQMVAPPESGRFRVSPPSHPVSSVWTVGWCCLLTSSMALLTVPFMSTLSLLCSGIRPSRDSGRLRSCGTESRFSVSAFGKFSSSLAVVSRILLGSCLRASSVFAGFVLRISVVSLCWVRAESMLRSCSKRRRETRVRTLKRPRKTRVRVLWRRRIS
ncbi:hypothetical protein IGI04_037233 [Brassica rapa subsp. trilocularis]|uniref:Transmembrane protein n=1 Tax=Brassica rapa subsp. trilocularis TaxID=1813537 RepID=A0ABQ7LGS9_BRACM|nr:hypothetical protein IGI04_037233 [Brassica rapa subsp. trilocularis]